MRPNTHHLARLAAAVLVSLTAFAVAGAARGGTPVSWTDPAGDSASAVDIQAVSLTDNGNGTVHVRIDLAATIPDDGDSEVAMWIDADRNPLTGSRAGNEFAVIADAIGVGLYAWSNPDDDWMPLDEHAPLQPTLVGGRLEFTLALADLGRPQSFAFYLASYCGDDVDWAPDDDAWGFTPDALPATAPAAPATPPQPAAPARPTVRGIMVTAAALVPKAGKAFTLPAPRLRLSNDEIVVATSYTCTLSNRGKVVKPLRKCTWTLARTTKGKTLSLKLTAGYQGQSLTTTLPVTPR